MRSLWLSVLVAIPSAALGQEHWLWENPVPTSWGINAIDGTSGTSAVAVTDRGEILRFSGSTWSVEARPVTVSLRAVDVVSSSVAWACGDSGQVVRNLGSGWSNVSNSPGGHNLSIAFRDGNVGVVGTRGNGVYWTSNSGSSWTLATGITGIINDVAWVGMTTVFATSGSTLYVSSNSGTSFAPVVGTGPATTLVAIAPFSATQVWVSAGTSAWLWSSGTWTTATLPGSTPSLDLIDVGVSSGAAYLVGYPSSAALINKQVYVLRTAGTTTFNTASPSVSLWDAAPRALFVDPTSASGDTVFVAGQGGMLLRTTNRGVNWGKNGASGQRYFSIDFVPGSSPVVAAAAGAEGALLVTTSGGGSWNEVYCVPPNSSGPIVGTDLADVAFNSSNGLAVGIFGTLCSASSADWNMWTRATVPSGSPMFREVTARSTDFVAGADDGLLYTINTAGAVTSTIDVDPSSALGITALALRPSGSELFVGAGVIPDGGATGQFYRRTTVGTNLPALTPALPAGHFVTDVAFLDSTTGFFLTSNGAGCTSATAGTVYRTTTGGTQWTQISTLGSCGGCFGWISLHPADANTVWVNGEVCGAQRLTFNSMSGLWETQAQQLGAPASVFKIRGPANDAANLWSVGSFGMVQRTRCGGSNTATCPVDSNACTQDVCVPTTGQCVKNVLGGQSCNDNTVCTSGDICRPDAGCSGNLITCDDNNACTSNTCDAVLGCQFPPAAGSCNDSNPCTNNDTCVNGSCQGSGIMCPPPNSCQVGACTVDGGCAYSNVQNGILCNDGSLCTVNDACQNGACVGATVNCNDGNPCTTDSCSVTSGCRNVPSTGSSCSSGDLCRVTEVCLADGGCGGGSALACNDGNPCTTDSCNPATGCVVANADGTPCTDSNACTDSDRCLGGNCRGNAVSCDDGNACTTDSCNPSTGCTTMALTNVPCSDSNACTQGDRCVMGVCTPMSTLSCDDSNPCTADSCDAGVGCLFQSVPDTTTCDDGNACSTGDRCVMGQCTATGGVICNDNNPCSSDSCNQTNQQCVFTSRDGGCNDGDTCTTADRCGLLVDGGVGCLGTPVNCDDGNPCTTDSCGASGCTSVPLAATVACNDGQACTVMDVCIPLVDGGVTCGGSPQICNDNNSCTLDACNPVDGGCLTTTTNQGGACSDGDSCTTVDTCNNGVCVGSSAVACNDNEPCTVDSCNPGSGTCVFAPTSACDGGAGGGSAGGGTAGGGAAGGLTGGGEAGGVATAGGSAGGSGVSGGAGGGSAGSAGGGSVVGGAGGADERPSVFKPGCGCSGSPVDVVALMGLALLARRRRTTKRRG